MKKVAVINDISGFGRCSLSAALPVISAMGIECNPLPTAVLSNQTGYQSFLCHDCTDLMDGFIDEWKKLSVHFDAILTGYCASAEQIEKIRHFITAFMKEDTLFVCDPVMGDDGKIYSTYNEEMCEKVCALAKHANIITPNLTELAIMTGVDYGKLITVDIIGESAKKLITGPLHTVIVTGLREGDHATNLVVTKNEITPVTNVMYGGSYSGTGDLFSSTLCGGVVKGLDVISATRLAGDFISRAVADTYAENTDRNDGVNFQKYLGMLI